ncbi:ras-domain-containing protein [Choiromyces venosus 120613-1]|uniref:Ras-domain-containing protein n=1 Tax=Choiromyces venosus 120613-1 TaxID=1336337 RepID=A0A3N4K5N0_9PEZI|nr:ras-domain-containing protein [Choiromyces venosus 120613-1]
MADPTIKLLLIGPSSSGKTALLLRYVEDIFDTDNATATIGVDFKVKKLSVKGKPHRILLFDTAGQERFRTLTSSYYRNAQGVLLVEKFAPPNAIKCLVGSKLDKSTSSRIVKTEEGRTLAERFGASFYEVSSKTRENVKEPFVDTVTRIVETPELMNGGVGVRRAAATPAAVVTLNQKMLVKKSGCC